MECFLSLGPAIKLRRGELWAKHMEQKCGSTGNILRNALGTLWEQKTTKKPLSPRPKRKQIGPLSIYVEPSPWLHQIFISKTVCHHFSPGLLEGLGCTLYGRM
jgi:hypothetical protein